MDCYEPTRPVSRRSTLAFHVPGPHAIDARAPFANRSRSDRFWNSLPTVGALRGHRIRTPRVERAGPRLEKGTPVQSYAVASGLGRGVLAGSPLPAVCCPVLQGWTQGT